MKHKKGDICYELFLNTNFPSEESWTASEDSTGISNSNLRGKTCADLKRDIQVRDCENKLLKTEIDSLKEQNAVKDEIIKDMVRIREENEILTTQVKQLNVKRTWYSKKYYLKNSVNSMRQESTEKINSIRNLPVKH